MALSPEVIKRIEELEKKYAVMGQDMVSYLDGLLYSNYLTYWDYTHVDTLLTLQNPKTDFPDELIFIIYHQVTELYFKLSLHELDQIAHNGRNVLPTGEDLGWKEKLDVNFFIEHLNRVNRYFEALTKSFDIMVDGMEPQQFLKFRMALLPASGFQSAQYRLIEISCTDFIRLIDKAERARFEKQLDSFENMFEFVYWSKGACDLATGKKTLTLEQFEKKYLEQFVEHAEEYKEKNTWKKYKSLSQEDQENPKLIEALRQLDVNVNINWPLVHYKSAVRYLQSKNEDVAATGGTNWQKYLPPRFQKRIFYPELWTPEELNEWGKTWVNQNVLSAG
jgi:tryptophan 2,3-dioxygenase